MKQIIALLLGISYVYGADVWQWNMMPKDNGGNDVNATNPGDLGICYGSSTQWSSYPYAAALRYSSGGACCSASIVSLNPPILISAAHCNGCTGQVRIGCNNPSNCDGDSYDIAIENGVTQFIQHPSYGSGLQFSSDIATIRLSTTINTAGATTRNIPSAETTTGQVRVVGYGVTQSGSIPSQLQTAEIPLIERTQCNSIMSSALGGGTYIDNTMICIRGGSAGQENVPATCSGDSGGPSSAGTSQYGVTSWGLQGSGTGCNSCNCCTGYPGVLANVAHFAGWINGYVNDWDAAYERDLNITRARKSSSSSSSSRSSSRLL